MSTTTDHLRTSLTQAMVYTIMILVSTMMHIDQKVAQYACQQVAFSTTAMAYQSILILHG